MKTVIKAGGQVGGEPARLIGIGLERGQRGDFGDAAPDLFEEGKEFPELGLNPRASENPSLSISLAERERRRTRASASSSAQPIT